MTIQSACYEQLSQLLKCREQLRLVVRQLLLLEDAQVREEEWQIIPIASLWAIEWASVVVEEAED